MAAKPYEPKDAFYRRAKQEGYRARSAYKLLEIARRFRLLRVRSMVLDLGSAPGGWLQVIGEQIGPEGRMVGVDLEAIAPIPLKQVSMLRGDAREPGVQAAIRGQCGGGLDVITSDMAPKTTGIREADEARSLELASLSLMLCGELLKPGGSFVAKVFEGGGFREFRSQVEKKFDRVSLIRPEATRGRSREIFVVAQGFGPAAKP